MNHQFDSIYQRRHYRWVKASKREAVRTFFMDFYNVPQQIYTQCEPIFVRLILNTIKSLDELEIPHNEEDDLAIINLFKQQPNIRNTKVFFTNPGVLSVWSNKYEGPVESFT